MKKHGYRGGYHPLVYCLEGNVYLTATVLGLIGLFLLSTAWVTRNNNDWWLNSPDPLLGINNRLMLFLVSAIHIGLSAYLFKARNLTNRNLAALWMGLNYLFYYVGAVLVNSPALFSAERFLGWRLQVEPTTVAAWWKVILAYLITASLASLYLTWTPLKPGRNQAESKSGEKMKTPQLTKKPVTRMNLENTGDYMKIVCPHCGQKIAFPLSRVGENIACPHCAARIRLQEPPARLV